ncbi:MAG: hypothetical protein GF330_04150 [Candidatus Eisenbacteria bacterium]|nr:hypothetical protein [Candidatus Eisenbacteria bacterium]
MRKRKQKKGIFCIEGLWDPDLRVTSTVRPILELLRLHEGIEYIHREYATREELEFYLERWTQRRYAAFPILYLASHGMESGVEIQGKVYKLSRMARLLEGKCEDRVLMFSSCSTLGIEKRKLQRFVRKTGALGVCGYRVDVDWMKSLAFELLLFSQMQRNEFSGRGISAIHKAADVIAGSFPELDFRMATEKDTAEATAKARRKVAAAEKKQRKAAAR